MHLTVLLLLLLACLFPVSTTMASSMRHGPRHIIISEHHHGPSSFDVEFPLGLCKGGCKDDTECQVSLYCFQRNPNELIPGCIGGEMDNTPTHYCTDVAPPDPASEHASTYYVPSPMLSSNVPSKPPSQPPAEPLPPTLPVSKSSDPSESSPYPGQTYLRNRPSQPPSFSPPPPEQAPYVDPESSPTEFSPPTRYGKIIEFFTCKVARL
jgi:hypothetical protein